MFMCLSTTPMHSLIAAVSSAGRARFQCSNGEAVSPVTGSCTAQAVAVSPVLVAATVTAHRSGPPPDASRAPPHLASPRPTGHSPCWWFASPTGSGCRWPPRRGGAISFEPRSTRDRGTPSNAAATAPAELIPGGGISGATSALVRPGAVASTVAATRKK